MSDQNQQKRVLGSLLSALGRGGQVVVSRKGRGSSGRGSKLAKGCQPCAAVKRAAKMANNRRFFGK